MPSTPKEGFGFVIPRLTRISFSLPARRRRALQFIDLPLSSALSPPSRRGSRADQTNDMLPQVIGAAGEVMFAPTVVRLYLSLWFRPIGLTFAPLIRFHLTNCVHRVGENRFCI